MTACETEGSDNKLSDIFMKGTACDNCLCLQIITFVE